MLNLLFELRLIKIRMELCIFSLLQISIVDLPYCVDSCRILKLMVFWVHWIFSHEVTASIRDYTFDLLIVLWFQNVEVLQLLSELKWVITMVLRG